MGDFAGDLYLSSEALERDIVVSDFGEQHLDRNSFGEFRVNRLVHLSHASASEQPNNTKSIGNQGTSRELRACGRGYWQIGKVGSIYFCSNDRVAAGRIWSVHSNCLRKVGTDFT